MSRQLPARKRSAGCEDLHTYRSHTSLSSDRSHDARQEPVQSPPAAPTMHADSPKMSSKCQGPSQSLPSRSLLLSVCVIDLLTAMSALYSRGCGRQTLEASAASARSRITQGPRKDAVNFLVTSLQYGPDACRERFESSHISTNKPFSMGPPQR